MAVGGYKQRLRIARRCGFRCYLCSRRIHVRVLPSGCHAMEHDEATIDHVIPRAHGGSNSEHNLAAACHQCNDVKGDLPALDLTTPDGRDRALGLHHFIHAITYLEPLRRIT